MENENKSLYKNGTSTTHALLVISSLIMIGLSVYLTNHYFQTHFPQGLGGSTLCELNSFLNCGAATYSPILRMNNEAIRSNRAGYRDVRCVSSFVVPRTLRPWIHCFHRCLRLRSG